MIIVKLINILFRVCTENERTIGRHDKSKGSNGHEFLQPIIFTNQSATRSSQVAPRFKSFPDGSRWCVKKLLLKLQLWISTLKTTLSFCSKIEPVGPLSSLDVRLTHRYCFYTGRVWSAWIMTS